MLSAQPITKDFKDLGLFNDLYKSAFPKSERAPMAFLFQRAKKDMVKFTAYYDEATFVGFSYTITVGDLTYLLYLAIQTNIRSKGYGAQILSNIKEQHPDNRIVLNIEIEDEKADNNAERIRRKSFYLKNGYNLTKIHFEMNKNKFDVLVNNGTCTAEEFKLLFKTYMGTLPYAIYRPKIHD